MADEKELLIQQFMKKVNATNMDRILNELVMMTSISHEPVALEKPQLPQHPFPS